MLLMDTSGSMSWDLNGDRIEDNFTKSRMDIAKEVVSEIVGSTNHVDFCLARFTGREGGDILQACGASKTTITSAVTNLIAAGATPLAESYYEILRYFQGVSSAYQAKMHVSPIKYRCQKNYAIVFTDGLPTYDSNFPGAPASLPNYDNLAPATTTTNFPPYSDGFGGNVRVGGSTLYLDDFAKYAFETNFKDSTALDLAGVSYKNRDFPKQNMLTYTISLGFGEDSNGDTKTVQMLVDAAEYGQGQAYNANDAATLGQSLSSALAEISGASQSLAAVSSDSGSLQSGLTLYQNRYSSGDWRGELVALSIEETTVNGKITYALKTEPKWIAPIKTGSNKIKPFRKRVLFTGFKGGNKFNYNTFKNQPEFATWFDSERSNINFLRGKVSSTGQRERELPMMGDVVNSAPVYVAGPKENLYTDTDPSFSAASEKYSEFYTQNKGRAAMLYHGANDGMLHGYEAAEGIERLGYFPEKVLPNLRHLISPTYQHQFYVDSTPMVDEAFNHVDNKWRTMLVSG
jgi:type IV pilus assembly protein PilY1